MKVWEAGMGGVGGHKHVCVNRLMGDPRALPPQSDPSCKDLPLQGSQRVCSSRFNEIMLV